MLNFLWSDGAKKKAWGIGLSTVAVLVGIALSVATRSGVEQVEHIVSPPETRTVRPSAAAQRMVAQQLTWAEQQTAELDPQLAVREFFGAAKLRTRPLAESILGWESKFRLGADYVTGSDDHGVFLQSQFERFLFSEAELDDLIVQTLATYQAQLKDIESQFLVRLEADLETLSPGELPSLVDINALRGALRQALDQATTAAQLEFRAAVGREAASWVAGEVLAVVGTQLATSAGVIGAGSGGSWGTFGLSLLASIAADYAITQWYHHQFDPIGQLERTLDECLAQIETALHDGTNEQPGLTQQFQHYAAQRNAARRSVIQQAVLVPGF